MKKILTLILLSSLFAGCMNCYVRCPGTSKQIETTYQSTQETFALAYVVMFPQVLPMNQTSGLVPANIVTIPLGALCYVDVGCECVLDTVFWPVDAWLESKRAPKTK